MSTTMYGMGRRHGRRGQATVEMTVAMLGALILIFGSFKVFLWLNERYVRRQRAYEATRTQAASTGPSTAKPVWWREPEKLNLFNEPQR
jgi:Flp pilus assembly protein TadG